MSAHYVLRNNHSGFTLLEILLVLVLLAILAVVAIPVYLSFQSQNDLDLAMTMTSVSLRRARLLSQAVKQDSGWGVKVEDGKVFVFKGSDFSNRDAIFDEINDITPGITVSGASQIVFYPFSGLPHYIGDITLQLNGKSRTIVINEKGMLE